MVLFNTSTTYLTILSKRSMPRSGCRLLQINLKIHIVRILNNQQPIIQLHFFCFIRFVYVF